jgi:VWFA-related protein
MCRLLFGVALALTITGAATPVNTAPAQTPAQTFTSRVTLVTVDVTVLDRDGTPVPGLTADDFTIKLNGKTQPVRALSYVTVAGPPAPEPSHDSALEVTGRRVITNTVPAGESPIVVIGVDDLSFPPSGGKQTLKAAREFVGTRPPDMLIGLMTTSGATVVNPTRDHALIASAIGHIVGAFTDPRRSRLPASPTLGIAESIDIVENNDRGTLEQMLTRECQEAGRTGGTGAYSPAVSMFNAKCAEDAQSSARLVAAAARGTTDHQISSLVTAISRMKNAAGLKQFVLLSEGIGATRNIRNTIDPVGRAAAEAGVRLSIVMEDEDTLDLGDGGHTVTEVAGQIMTDTGMANRVRADKAMFRSSLETLADVTGGTFETVVADGTQAFRRAAVAGSAVYRVGVEVPSDLPASKPIAVLAAVKRDGVSVHANRQAIVPAPAPRSNPEDEIAAAIAEGRPLYSVPVRLAVAMRRASGNQVELGVGMDVPASVKGPIAVTFGLVDQKGELRKGRRVLPQPAAGADYRLTFPMPVAPGTYSLRFAVADADGRVGSIETPVDATLFPMGTLDASDVLTWWIDPTGQAQFLALDQVPAGVTSLGAGLELYPRPGTQFPDDVKVTLSRIPGGTGNAVVEQQVTPRVGNDMFRAEAMLPLAGVPSGAYVLNASVTAGGQPVGHASAVVYLSEIRTRSH